MACRSIRRCVVIVFTLSPLPFSFCWATSIVAKLEKDQVFLAVDTRLDRLQGKEGLTHSFHDDGCKMIALGTAAVAVGGFADYKRGDPSDGVDDWSALSDAAETYVLHENDLKGMAREWAERAKSHFSQFYRFAPERVRKMAGTNPEGILVHAFIVGWSNQNEPLLIWEKIYFDEHSTPRVRKLGQLLASRELPYTTHAISQELIETDSERAREVRNTWQSRSQKVPDADRGWRWLDFVVESTSIYDETVGPRVNVLRIPLGGRAEWLQNLTCR